MATGSSEMQAGCRTPSTTGTTVVDRYRFDAVHVRLLVPFGKQDGLSLGGPGHTAR